MERGAAGAGAVEPEPPRDPDSRTGALPDRPRSVRSVSTLLLVLVVLLGVAVVLARVLRDDLVLAWAAGDDTAGPLVAAGGLDALEQSAIAVPSFPMLAVTAFVVFGMLVGVLLVFLRQGYGWARVGLTLAVLFLGSVAALGLGVGVPAPFVALLAASLAVDAALLVLLWHRDTTGFLRRRALVG